MSIKQLRVRWKKDSVLLLEVLEMVHELFLIRCHCCEKLFRRLYEPYRLSYCHRSKYAFVRRWKMAEIQLNSFDSPFRERSDLKHAVDVMVDLGLTYIQIKSQDGTFQYRLEPDIEILCNFECKWKKFISWLKQSKSHRKIKILKIFDSCW